MKHKAKKECYNCVMNDQVPGVEFDINGICNYCKNFLNKRKELDKTRSHNDLKKLVISPILLCNL